MIAGTLSAGAGPSVGGFVRSIGAATTGGGGTGDVVVSTGALVQAASVARLESAARVKWRGRITRSLLTP